MHGAGPPTIAPEQAPIIFDDVFLGPTNGLLNSNPAEEARSLFAAATQLFCPNQEQRVVAARLPDAAGTPFFEPFQPNVYLLLTCVPFLCLFLFWCVIH